MNVISKNATLKMNIKNDPRVHDFYDFIGKYYAYFGNFFGGILNGSEFVFKDNSKIVVSQKKHLKIIIEKVIDEQVAAVKKLISTVKGCNIHSVKDIVCLDEMHRAMYDFVNSFDQVNKLEDSSVNDNNLTSSLSTQMSGL